MTSKEALEKLDNTLCLNSQSLKFNIDTEENIDCKDVYEMIECLEIIKKDLEVLDWLIEKMYVAGGLIELKVCPLNNPTIPKYHNGIETHDTRFNDFINRISELKYKR